METPELHRPFDIVALPESGRAIDIAPNAEEREAIAARLGLVALHDMRLHGQLRPLRRGFSAMLQGRLTASVTQSCIVTLDPVDAAVDEEIEVRLLTEAEADARSEVEIEADEDDVEIAEGGVVDVGDVAVQYLALSLDPYPRSPGAAEMPLPETADEEESSSPNPFAVLKKLKDNA